MSPPIDRTGASTPTETHPPSTPAGAHQQKLVSHAGDDRIRELPVRRGEPFVDEENDPFAPVANDDDSASHPLTPAPSARLLADQHADPEVQGRGPGLQVQPGVLVASRLESHLDRYVVINVAFSPTPAVPTFTREKGRSTHNFGWPLQKVENGHLPALHQRTKRRVYVSEAPWRPITARTSSPSRCSSTSSRCVRHPRSHPAPHSSFDRGPRDGKKSPTTGFFAHSFGRKTRPSAARDPRPTRDATTLRPRFPDSQPPTDITHSHPTPRTRTSSSV